MQRAAYSGQKKEEIAGSGQGDSGQRAEEIADSVQRSACSGQRSRIKRRAIC
ncbi:MAG: hypothetical protein WC644_06220 [Ignavibacteria bacterium]